MWPTSEGDRTLHGSEAMLVANAVEIMLDLLIDYLDTDEDTDPEAYAAVLQTGISVFDSLSISQRVGVLHRTAVHLLTDTPFAESTLSAVDDAAIAAVYQEVRDRVEIEIDFSDDFEPAAEERPPDDPLHPLAWRRLVHRACCEKFDDGEWCDVRLDSELAAIKLEDWESWIDCLACAILWDHDYEFAESFLDADPDTASHRRSLLGIDDEYFVRPAPDPSPDRIERMIRQTQRIIRNVKRRPARDARPLDDEPV